MLIDTHAHLDKDCYKNEWNNLLERAGAAGVTRVITVGNDVSSSRKAAALARKFPEVYASAGIHPHAASTMNRQAREELSALAAEEKVVAIGETGLDFYRYLSPPEKQLEAFREHLKLARDLGLPVIVHSREASREVLAVLREHGRDIPGVWHCFSGDQETARRCLERGFYISLGGPVTFKKANLPREIARFVPLKQLLLETDCPYLAPEPYRGKRNEPAYLLEIAREIANLRGISLKELAGQTWLNARELFGIKGV